jgi:alpha-1,2-mannosyltransferase
MLFYQIDNKMNSLKQRTKASDNTHKINEDQCKENEPHVQQLQETCPIKQSSFLSTNIFMVILTIRTISVCFNLIWDCDEVYNYWEPLHFILYGNGFQTWEYSPVYSLRSYLYICLHALPLWPFRSIVASKITLFYMLRFTLAYVSTKLETRLYKSLKRQHSRIADYYIVLSLTNVGMFQSVTSFLPSTFAMYLITLAYASWLNYSRSKVAIFAIGFAILGKFVNFL